MIDLAGYLDDTCRADRISGGERMIPISTPKGSHLALVDDAEAYFSGLVGFLRALEGR